MTRIMSPLLAVGLAMPIDYGRWQIPEAALLKPKYLSPKASQKLYSKYVLKAAKKYNLDPKLLWAVITIESGWQVNALSKTGAMGLMQLMPETARRYGVRNAFNAKENIFGGARYLRYLLNLFDGNLTLAVAAYNSGHGRVLREMAVPKIKQTQKYVELVLENYRQNQPRLFFQ